MNFHNKNKCGFECIDINQMFSRYEVFVYENQNWSEIPETSHPAYVNMNNKDFHALLICKVLPSECGVTGRDGYIVTDISGRFVACRRLGVFWQLVHAKIFAYNYAKEVEPTVINKKSTKVLKPAKNNRHTLNS